MERSLRIIAVMVALLILGLGFFIITRDQPPVPETPDLVSEEKNSFRSLRSLMNHSGSQICEFADDKSGGSGSVYVSSGRVRGDFNVLVNEKIITSHFYSDGQTAYLWMTGSGTGYKSPVDSTVSQSSDGESPSTRTNFDIDQEVDYRCQPWSADESVFSLPAGVEFVDFSTLR